MDQEKQKAITSLFEVVSSIERKWANEWNNHNVLGFSKSHILILDYLSQEGPKRPSAIAERLKVTRLKHNKKMHLQLFANASFLISRPNTSV